MDIDRAAKNRSQLHTRDSKPELERSSGADDDVPLRATGGDEAVRGSDHLGENSISGTRDEKMAQAEKMAHKAKAEKKKLQMEFDAENEDMVKRLKLEIDLEMSTQQGHRLDDHQSPLSTEQYSASSRRPMHVHATCTRLHLTPHPVSHELLTRTCSHTRATLITRLITLAGQSICA